MADPKTQHVDNKDDEQETDVAKQTDPTKATEPVSGQTIPRAQTNRQNDPKDMPRNPHMPGETPSPDQDNIP